MGLFLSFLGYFFSVCFLTAQKVIFFCIFAIFLSIWGYFLTDLEVILGPLGAFFEKRWFFENHRFPLGNIKVFKG